MRSDHTSSESPGRETIEKLFAALESPLLAYALHYTDGLAQAEDVVQEAFMKLHAQFGRVNQPRSWLYRTVHNLALNRRRTARQTVPLDSPADFDQSSHLAELADATLPPDEQMLRLEGIGQVRLSLATLDARSREVVSLKFNDELSYQDIATRTGLTPGNVGFILHHALKTIAAELAKTGVVS